MTRRKPRAPVAAALFVGAVLCAALCGAGGEAMASGGFYVPAGDGALRSDLQRLVDAGVIDLPLMGWPVSRADVESALEDAPDDFEDTDLSLAYGRVQEKLQRPGGFANGYALVETHVGSPGLLRNFDAVSREEGELAVEGGVNNDDAAFVARVTAATSPADNQSLRADGSELTFHLGNWLIGANTLDRWWGPGQESSLILSNNARPIPALMLERATSRAPRNRWFSWLGPWRFTTLFGQMDSNRQDIPRPLFLGLRLEMQPLPWLDFALSRTNQFCGEGRKCDLTTLGNLLIGRDNAGIDVTRRSQSGYGLTGYDLRVRSPWQRLPVAVYAQLIGADESQYHPEKFLGLFGTELWLAEGDGGSWRADLEYSDTTCNFARGTGALEPHFNCAYNNNLYNVEGYRYLGRSVGYTTDNDSRLWDAGLRYARLQGDEWRLELLAGHLNRDQSVPDPLNTVAQVATLYRALEGGWRGYIDERAIDIQLGIETLAPRGGETVSERSTSLYGFIGWQRSF
jgi:hypothetical protein